MVLLLLLLLLLLLDGINFLLAEGSHEIPWAPVGIPLAEFVLATVLTYKSIVAFEHRGERLIKPSSS